MLLLEIFSCSDLVDLSVHRSESVTKVQKVIKLCYFTVRSIVTAVTTLVVLSYSIVCCYSVFLFFFVENPINY